MTACASCGSELVPHARFCPYCGTPVEAEPATEERRIVSILFVDLVGFTERSDRADPEDVRRTLLPFHTSVKEDLERFGGTLDKFIGDAVMGVFGAPVAHEDDPIRAVRAALRILRSMDALRAREPHLGVRIAVNTGEAVVSFGAGPQVGEAVAGDVVNTASRMQSLAPADGIVVGETTLRALRDQFEVEPLPPATVKGKADPLRVWRVVAERETVDAGVASTFVGRDRELALLVELFERAVEEASVQVVTILGDPGLGKSRLVAELERSVAPRARRITGGCLPYGEGVTFAPLDDTLRTLAEVSPTDDASMALRRLEDLARLVEPEDDIERRWLTSRLAPVMTIADGSADGAIATGEIADAWARVLTHAARDLPLVLVIEDVHWADPSLIEVLERALDRLSGARVFAIATARHELLERHDGWAAGRADAITLSLRPLREEETERLLASIVLGVRLADETRATLLERAGGNPLYAVEFARMLAEPGADAAAQLGTPETVHALIGARLDALEPDLRTMVQDASVLGDEVTVGGLAAVSGAPPGAASEALVALSRRAVVETRAPSPVGGDAYRFTHALIREVAYGRLPRGARARRHLAAGEWLAAAASDRVDEQAETLARHFAEAAEAGASARDDDLVRRARGPAVRWLLAAGDRAATVDPGGAFVTYERALALAPERDRARMELLGRTARAGRLGGTLDGRHVLERLEEALAIARELGDDTAVGEWLTRLGSQLGALGEASRAREALAESVRVLESLPPGRMLARAYAHRAEEELFAGRVEEAMALAGSALALVEPDDEFAVMALHLRGDARCSLGDVHGGIADLREALRIAEAAGSSVSIVTSRSYLAEWMWAAEGPAAGLALWEPALELAERRNVRSQAAYLKIGALEAVVESGDWDRALGWADDIVSMPEHTVDAAVRVRAHASRAHVLLARGRRDLVLDPADLAELARGVDEVHVVAPALVAAAATAMADRAVEDAVRHLEAFEAATRDLAPEHRAAELARVVRVALAAGRVDLAEDLVGQVEPALLRDRLQRRAGTAALAEALGDPDAADAYAEVAELWRGYGNVFEEAIALLGHARLATETGQAQVRAYALLRRLGVAEAEAWA